MPRRSIATLLLFAYIAGQLAVAPHAHKNSSAMQPCDHNARPHLHVSWFGHDDDHGRDHHHGSENSTSLSSSSDPTLGNNDHDSDAIYLSNETGTPSRITKSCVLPDGRDAVSSLSMAVGLSPAVAQAEVAHPGSRNSACPLYLTLRTLRI